MGKLQVSTAPKEGYFVPYHSPSWFRETFRPDIRFNEFAVEPLTVDQTNFDRKHYTFEPVRWEYLGDVRCLVIDVHPRGRAATGAFEGRIWVEDHDYAIVRLNGTRINPPRFDFYVHFDCWRENLQPDLWLPVYTFSQETDIGKRLQYKAEHGSGATILRHASSSRSGPTLWLMLHAST